MEGIVMESVWVAVGFVVFIALVWKKSRCRPVSHA